MSNQQAPAFPTTEHGIYVEATRVRGLRREGLSWREVSEATGYTRVEAIRLAHGESQLMAAVAASRYSEMNYRNPPANTKEILQ